MITNGGLVRGEENNSGSLKTMSPLIDVTNTEVVTTSCNGNLPHHGDRLQGREETPKVSKASKCSAEEGNYASQNEEPRSSKASGSVRRQLKRNKLKNFKKSKNNPTVKVDLEPSLEKRTPPAAPVFPPRHNNRVPPLPSVEFLSSAVDTLSISSEAAWHQRPSILKKRQPESESAISVNVVSSSSQNNQEDKPQPSSSVCTSTYQCVACGLEFSTLEHLTPHLVKHIFEGLHAAAWLNEVMAPLLVPVAAAPTEAPVNPTTAARSGLGRALTDNENHSLNSG